MNKTVDKRWLISLILIPALLACNFVTRLVSNEPATAVPEALSTRSSLPAEASEVPETPGVASQAAFSPILFCAEVTDEGQCLGQADVFPAGTEGVWAYFTYQDMPTGQSWGRYWTLDGQEFIDETGQSWEEEAQGWTAYFVEKEDGNLSSGEYSLTLYLGEQAVQSGVFRILQGKNSNEPLSGTAAFGNIQFAEGVNAEALPINPRLDFPQGTQEVYAVFSYFNFQAGQSWRVEWLRDGQTVASKDLQWEEGTEGFAQRSLVAEDSGALDPGLYTLNLYLDGQLARSASFRLFGESAQEAPTATTPAPSTPEELIDTDLMPAWNMLVNSREALLRSLAELVLNAHIEVRMADNMESGTLARYSYSKNSCEIQEKGARPAGKVYVNRQAWNESSWEEVAAYIAHELTHAYQHLRTGYRCDGCSIEKEYEAFMVTIYSLEELNRWDLVQKKYPGLTDHNGTIYKDKLWEVLKKSYSDCPEY